MKIKLIILILLIVSISYYAQKQNLKAFGVGISVSGTSIQTPNIAKTPYLFYRQNYHQVFVGLDIYELSFYNKRYNIFGLQTGYSYYFRPSEKKVNFFANCNFQYVQYSTGTSWAVPYNYTPSNDEDQNINLYRHKSFLNNYGLGINCNFLKICSAYMMVAGGYNYYTINLSPYSNFYQRYDYTFYPIKNWVPSFMVKIGLSFKIYTLPKKQLVAN